jgi:hypothetical protein
VRTEAHNESVLQAKAIFTYAVSSGRAAIPVTALSVTSPMIWPPEHTSGVEARALVADRVLTNDWRGPGDAIAISAHELEALCAFRHEVGEAWDRFRARTGEEASERSAA